MASSKTISNEYKERANYNRLQTIALKTQHLSVNNLPPNLLNINKPLNGLEYVGINMKPCEYCKTVEGQHYHDLDRNTSYDNWIDNKHMCKFCKENPGAIHFHFHN
jgi:hypothetical protein